MSPIEYDFAYILGSYIIIDYNFFLLIEVMYANIGKFRTLQKNYYSSTAHNLTLFEFWSILGESFGHRYIAYMHIFIGIYICIHMYIVLKLEN
jgi:hypothetical protein